MRSTTFEGFVERGCRISAWNICLEYLFRISVGNIFFGNICLEYLFGISSWNISLEYPFGISVWNVCLEYPLENPLECPWNIRKDYVIGWVGATGRFFGSCRHGRFS